MEEFFLHILNFSYNNMISKPIKIPARVYNISQRRIERKDPQNIFHKFLDLSKRDLINIIFLGLNELKT